MAGVESVQKMVKHMVEEEDDEELLDWISDGEDEINIKDMEVMDKSFPETIFVSNLPKVPEAKLVKLTSVLDKIFQKSGDHTTYMPLNPATGTTDGYVIVTFTTAQEADNAVASLNGLALDKTHTFKVVKFDQYDKIVTRPEEFNPKNNIQRPSRQDHRDWLADPQTREQFLLRYNTETEIFWNDPNAGEPKLYYGGEREKQGGKIWCDWKVQFSPQGSFIATFHKQGIALWAGDQFQKWKVRFPHANVKYIEFSPNEEFLLTWNGSHPQENDESAVCIFRVLSGECMRKCRTPVVSPLNEKCEFPHFLWSRDGRYFAECNESTIVVRDTETFDLIKDDEGRKRSLKYENLDTFQWSPKDNIIAAWTTEKANNPARLVLVSIPDRKELAARCRTSCEAKMHWQSEGDYLCLLVTKLSKTGKKGATNLEIFRIRDKNCPVDIVEIKDTVKAFHWETGGNRFCVITTDDTGHKPKLTFYQLGAEKCENVRSLDLPANSFTDVFWAPGGQYFVCAAMQGGDLLFGGLMPDNKLEVLHRDEHFMLTNVEWDPSSRYVITAVTQPMRDEGSGFKYQMEAGYAIWTFQGRQLHKQQKEKLYVVGWRPHPPSLLSQDQASNIKKNIKKFSKKYDALDENEKETARAAFKADRDKRTEAFMDILYRIAENNEEMADANGWTDAVDAWREDQVWEKVETTIEEDLDANEELIQ
jgi:translation initiation factor 3 subunit B